MSHISGLFINKLNNLCDKVTDFTGFISGVFILITGLIVTYEVIMRFIFFSPTSWVLEISVYLCIAATFLATGYTQKEKSHITVETFLISLCVHDQLVIKFLTNTLSLLYVAILMFEGAKIAIMAYLSGEASPTVLKVPLFIIRAFVPLGCFILLVQFIKPISGLVSELRATPKELNEGVCFFRKNIFPIIFLSIFVLGTVMLFYEGLAPYGCGILLFTLLFGGMPIAFALGLIGALGFFIIFGGNRMLVQVPLVAYKVLDDFVLVAVPLFIMTSAVLLIGKVGEDLFRVVNKWVRHLPGGLAVAAILACGIFAAIAGSSTATVAAIGLIALPEMLSAGYKRDFTYGTLAIGGVLGPLIPPSVFMIIIGSMSGESVGKLFMSGMIPGIMLMVFFSTFIIIYSIRDKSMPRMSPVPMKERWAATRKAFWGILTPIIILGGIYTGIFTPTESAGIGVAYTLFISLFIYRSIHLKEFYSLAMECARLSCMILFIVGGSMIFGQLITMMNVPQNICDYIGTLPFSHMTILWIAIALLMILGCLMDALSILLITFPILYYIFVENFGFDIIWFSLVYVFVLEVGLVTPPFGMNLFIIQGLDKQAKYNEVLRGVLPFMIIMIISILLVVYIRPLSVWLPQFIG